MAHQAKLDKAVVLYMGPELTGPKGANCGSCMMYLTDTSECSVVRPAVVKSHGVCGLYVHGKPTTTEDHKPMKIVPKEVAGYTDDGPTRCGTCEYALMESTACAKVAGQIHPYGCCNAYEAEE